MEKLDIYAQTLCVETLFGYFWSVVDSIIDFLVIDVFINGISGNIMIAVENVRFEKQIAGKIY